MPDENDNLIENLNQIKEREQQNLDKIETLKLNADRRLLPEIEKIERNTIAIISEIEAIGKSSGRQPKST